MNCYKIYADKYCNTVIENDEFKEGFVNIYILQKNKENCTSTNQIVYRENPEDPVVFDIGQDGYYLLCKIVVPTDETSPYYYKDKKIYDSEGEVDLQYIIDSDTGIEITYEDYFQICHLRQCFVEICKDILNRAAPLECSPQQIDKHLTYKRDLLWAAINVINYLVEQEQYEEADRLLTRITGCNGLCESKSNCNCGCCGDVQ